MECVDSSLIIVGVAILHSIIVGGVRCFCGVRCFFFNYCWWSALFLLQLLLVECVVSSLIIVGGVRCFFFNYCWWSALFLL